MKKRVASETKWESFVGYSRAVRVDNIVEVSGTSAVDRNGKIIGEDNPYEQAVFIFRKIAAALHQTGATMADVVRTRMYVTDITRWEEVGRAHGEVFADTRPVSTLVQVPALIEPGLMVEIEVTAVLT